MRISNDFLKIKNLFFAHDIPQLDNVLVAKQQLVNIGAWVNKVVKWGFEIDFLHYASFLSIENNKFSFFAQRKQKFTSNNKLDDWLCVPNELKHLVHLFPTNYFLVF